MIWFISIWAISSILCHGMLFAWCQRGCKVTNYREDFVFSISISVIGNVYSLIATIILLEIREDRIFRYGFKFW